MIARPVSGEYRLPINEGLYRDSASILQRAHDILSSVRQTQGEMPYTFGSLSATGIITLNHLRNQRLRLIHTDNTGLAHEIEFEKRETGYEPVEVSMAILPHERTQRPQVLYSLDRREDPLPNTLQVPLNDITFQVNRIHAIVSEEKSETDMQMDGIRRTAAKFIHDLMQIAVSNTDPSRREQLQKEHAVILRNLNS